MGYRLNTEAYPQPTLDELRETLALDVRTAAGALRIGEKTLRAKVRNGDVPVIRAGRNYRIPTSYVLRQLGV
jgi:excisionase family DNA binding protein